MSTPEETASGSRISEVSPQVEQAGKAFVAAWICNSHQRVEPFLEDIPEDMLAEAHDILIRLEIHLRGTKNEQLNEEEYHQRFPDFELEVEQAFQADSKDETASLAHSMSNESSAMGESADFNLATSVDKDVVPEQIGRYRVDGVLGSGGFGVVCLATDMELDRQVALKLARSTRFRSRKEMDDLIAEARTAAQLSHPGIVAVHDVLVEDDSVAIIQQLISGQDLATELEVGLPTFERTAELIIAICKAIAFAHSKGFFHRDIKPANILLNEEGKPHIADFGLAIHESFQRRRRGDKSGTPRYMSPELVRGESHRIDGRSDIWSIGVMLFEMLTGKRPFAGETKAELFDEIKHRDPKPLRQVNREVPVELERICLKCLAKPVSERYATATDVADDLGYWLQLTSVPHSVGDSSSEWMSEMIPRGLRSFTAEDTTFFNSLLPGPVGRDGLPESIRFWKSRVEDPDNALEIGLLYGPSGCGKSSFIMAGLLPNLARFVKPVRVEATSTDTEVRLIRALRSRYSDIPTELSLPEVFHSLREGVWGQGSDRILIVIDQFEQWLHNRSLFEMTELVEGLRHCDGRRLQCLLTVRDDFWLATSRFLKALEVELVEGHNAALVDLFDKRHARRVLRQYGRGYDRIDEKASRAQDDFVTSAVDELADNDRVICVRLALVAEMFKDKPWTPAALKKAGGIAGVGVAFLEDNFSSKSARPEYRIHEEAARKVLGSLLPDSTIDIRGNMRSRTDLLHDSGYANRPNAFADLMRILDNELRLITPTDPEGIRSGSKFDPASDKSYFQLTHDYLVAPLRIWLNQKQQESVRGRARLRLDERFATWSRTRENRFLPPLGEYLNIRFLAPSSTWVAGEREMMKQAGKSWGLRLAIAVGVLMMTGFLAKFGMDRYKAKSFASRLVESETPDVVLIVDEIEESGLTESVAGFLDDVQPEGHRQDLNVDLGLAHRPESRTRLWERIVVPDSLSMGSDIETIAKIVEPTDAEKSSLWQVLQLPAEVGDRRVRLRAATALAVWDTDDSRWQDVSSGLATALLKEEYNASGWASSMSGIRESVLRSLIQNLIEYRFLDSENSEQQDPAIAMGIIFDNRAEWPGMLEHLKAQLEMFGQQKNEVDSNSTGEQVEAWELVSQKHANVGSILAALGQKNEVTPLLTMGRNEITRGLLIEQMDVFGATRETLLSFLEGQRDSDVRAAVWLAIGKANSIAPVRAVVSNDNGDKVLSRARMDFVQDQSAQVHAAIKWLLHRTGQQAWVENTQKQISSLEFENGNHWREGPYSGTMVRVPAPGRFPMSLDRFSDINYEMEVGANEVSWEQFLAFCPQYAEVLPDIFTMNGADSSSPASRQLPVTQIQWYLAAEYCNWLSAQHGIPKDQWCYEYYSDMVGSHTGSHPFSLTLTGTGVATVTVASLPKLELNPVAFVNDEYRPCLRLAADYEKRAGYRLPLEHEWDYWAQSLVVSNRQTRLLFKLAQRFNVWGQNNSGDNRFRAPARFPANRWGIEQLFGNVAEMCSDYFSAERNQNHVPANKGAFLKPGEFLEKWQADPRFFRQNALIKGLSVVQRSTNHRAALGRKNVNLYYGFRVMRIIQNESR